MTAICTATGKIVTTKRVQKGAWSLYFYYTLQINCTIMFSFAQLPLPELVFAGVLVMMSKSCVNQLKKDTTKACKIFRRLWYLMFCYTVVFRLTDNNVTQITVPSGCSRWCLDDESTKRHLKNYSHGATSGCQLDFVKKKKGFFKRFSFQKKKVFNARKKVFLLRAYFNTNSKR